MALPISVDKVTSIAAKVDSLIKALPSARCRALAVPCSRDAYGGSAANGVGRATQIAIDLNLFEKLTEQGEVSRSIEQLAAMVSAEPAVLERILRHLAAMGLIHEAGPGAYEYTPLSKALTKPQYRDAVPIGFDMLIPAHAGLREYLAKSGYQNPDNPSHGPFQMALRTHPSFFEWLQSHPTAAAQFNNHMAGYSLSRARWMDPGCVPVEDVLSTTCREDEVLLVDVGGGNGHDIALFQKQHAKLPGRLILQDVSTVIEGCRSSLPPGIEPMAHDFFTPQPIKGACAYYLHSILHDWPDEKCREILRNIMSAMRKGHGKILLNENVIPKTCVHWETSGLDLMMMSSFTSQERTQEKWYKLLQSVGLRIVKIWDYEKGTENLIEAELA